MTTRKDANNKVIQYTYTKHQTAKTENGTKNRVFSKTELKTKPK